MHMGRWTLTLFGYLATRKHKSKKQEKVEEKAEDSDDDLDATPPPAKKPRGREYIHKLFPWYTLLTLAVGARKPKIDNDMTPNSKSWPNET